MASSYPDDIKATHAIPELRHLRCFLAVAECLHFGQAAERLGLAQPPLSQQIQRLERLIGYPLFRRSKAGPVRVALTPAGEALVGPAQRALRAGMLGIDAARRAGRGEQQRLTIGFAASCAAAILAPLLREYRARHPEIILTLRELTTAAQADALRDGDIDIGIGREVAATGEFEALALARERLVALLPSDHSLARRRTLSPEDLRTENFVMIPRSAGPAFHDQLVNVCRRAGFEPDIVQEATEWATVAGLVGSGIGVSIAPESAGVSGSDAVPRPLRDVNATTIIAAWWLRDDNAVIRQGFRAIADAFAKTRLRNKGP